MKANITNNPNNQKGIGLLEVLIAVILLAVAVLGFSAMQMRAIKATDETLLRSDALIAIRSISEDMRLYPSVAQKTAYKQYIASNPTAKPKDCRTSACNSNEQMKYTAYNALQLAKDSQISLGAVDCPGASRDLQKVCLIASWNDTLPKMDGTANACTDANGAYNMGATCFVIETY